ncbi:hypothetical protein CCYA_CCYA02G0552 [Cyanidiococcus yangmingshanensis]|nr:hypothetical protein CCYA_CCYA02G0552 [Cyanidiococcus yangmingshanensis]
MEAQPFAQEVAARQRVYDRGLGFVPVFSVQWRLKPSQCRGCLWSASYRRVVVVERDVALGASRLRSATACNSLRCTLAEEAANPYPVTSVDGCAVPRTVRRGGRGPRTGERLVSDEVAAGCEQRDGALDGADSVLSLDARQPPKQSVAASGRRRQRRVTSSVKATRVAISETPLQTPLEETVITADPRLPVPNWPANDEYRPRMGSPDRMALGTRKVSSERDDQGVREPRPARRRRQSAFGDPVAPVGIAQTGSWGVVSRDDNMFSDWGFESDEGDVAPLADEDLDGFDQGEREVGIDAEERLSLAARANRHRRKDSESSTLRWYLHMIGRVDMLSPQEEIALSRKISQLLHWERVRLEMHDQLDRSPTDEELAEHLGIESTVFKRSLAEARRAKDRMVAANLRLVVSIAKRYLRRGLPLEDLIQEGSLGLIRAAEKFDIRRGCRFSTYATWWVKQSVMRALADQGRTVRLPVHLHDRLIAMRKAVRSLSIERGREPTEREICDRLGISRRRLRELRSLAVQTISLESAVRFGNTHSGPERERTTLADNVVHEGASPEEQLEFEMLREDLERSLQRLSHVEKRIVRLRYGLDSGIAKTVDEVGALVCLPREEVRAIESAAFRKLRHTGNLTGLKDYITTSSNTSAL